MAKEKSKQKTAPASSRPKSSSVMNQSTATTSGSGNSNGNGSSNNASALLSAFSPLSSSRFFAQVSTALDSHTVRIFDTSSSRVTSRWAGNGSSEKVMSLEWVLLDVPTGAEGKEKPRGKKRRKSSTGGATVGDTAEAQMNGKSEVSGKQEALALGLSNGSVVLIHPSLSSVIQTLSHSSVTQAVTSLSYPAPLAATSPNLLWTAAASGHVCAWHLPSSAGESAKLVARYETAGNGWSKITVRYTTQQKAQILSAQHAIKLYEVDVPISSSTSSSEIQTSSAELKATFTGHTSEVSQLLWLPTPSPPAASVQHDDHVNSSSSVRFTSVATSDRFVSVWHLPTISTSESVQEGALAASYALSDDVLRVVLSPSSTIIACLATSGSATLADLSESLFAAQAGVDSKKKRRKSLVGTVSSLCTIDVKKQAESGTEGVTNAKFGSDNDILEISRSVVKPTFEKLSYRDSAGSVVPELELQKSKGKGVLVSGDADTGAPTQRASYAENTQSVVLPASAMAQEEPVQAASTSTNEPTLAERLRGLQVEAQESTSTTLDKLGDKSGTKLPRKSVARRIADASSLSSSLVQALHSNDHRLLESCLSQTDPRILRNTIQRVPNTLILPLVEVLVERLGRSSSKGFGGSGASGASGVDAHRGHELLLWLRHVLVIHLSYLVTVPSLVNRLANLHATLENRLSFHNQLLALSGRLDLVVSQIDMRADRPVQAVGAAVSGGSRGMQEGAGPSRYVEGEEDSQDSSSSEEEDEDEEDVVAPAEEGGEVEDLVMGAAGESDESDEDENMNSASDSEDDDEEPIIRSSSKKSKKPQTGKVSKIKINGFLDTEAEEASSNEDDDAEDDELGLNGYASLTGRRKVARGDDDEKDEEDEDEYESDFINDEEEEEEDESEDE